MSRSQQRRDNADKVMLDVRCAGSEVTAQQNTPKLQQKTTVGDDAHRPVHDCPGERRSEKTPA